MASNQDGKGRRIRTEGSKSYDWIVIGSGFGGSVSALRLVEKGYKVLLIEKGKRWKKEDFPKSNWNLKRWLWMPRLGFRGIFQMSFMRHLTVLHGVGVGGGSLVYANTLPMPKDEFFAHPLWGDLADWKDELAPHYETAKYMLGATVNPRWTKGDAILQKIAKQMGREDEHQPTEVAVFFGEEDVTVKDPYFGGEGPDRTGCTHCGACMTGCRVGAKNTLDKNYLYFAEKKGLTLISEQEVTAIREHPSGGYLIESRSSKAWAFKKKKQSFLAPKVVLSGGVMGTLPLLLAMKKDPKGLPKLSPQLGKRVRSNSESLIGVAAPGSKDDFSEGVAITSIFHTDPHSHIEPVRYGRASGAFRFFMLPHASHPRLSGRLFGMLRSVMRHPWRWAKTLVMRPFSSHTQILLYMRTLDETLHLDLGRKASTGFQRGLVSRLPKDEKAPTSVIPEATALADAFADEVEGVTASLLQETLMGTPTTAHILGGASMGKDAQSGVINQDHEVFGYKGLYVVDGSAISANPGVNPSLTITAMAERAMAKIPRKG